MDPTPDAVESAVGADLEAADELQELLEAQEQWPPPSEWRRQRDLQTFAALRESDSEALKSLIGWDFTRGYVIDPLPQRISEAFADALFGEDPAVSPADEANDDALANLVEANDLPSELHRAEEICSSEGEVWWRVIIDKALRYPLIEWHSRTAVFPLWRGKSVVACAFISILRQEDAVGEATNEGPRTYTRTWRHVEIQADGIIRNLLYRGEPNDLGETVALSDEADIEDLPEEWEHGLPMLAGRIVNKSGRDPQVGISDYAGVRELLLSLNEAQTVGSENMRLTAKKRIFVSGDLTNAQGDFDANVDVIKVEEEGGELSESKSGTVPIKEVEYSYDAAALIAHIDHTVETIVTRVGLVAEFIGTDRQQGEAVSGTSLRLRMIPTTLATKGKGRPWDDQLPKILALLQLIDAKPEAEGGFGRSWTDPASAPAVERKDAIPEDIVEQAARHTYLRSAGLESQQVAIKDLHPDWSEEQITEELGRIKAENQPVAGGGTTGGEIAKPRAPISLHLPTVG